VGYAFAARHPDRVWGLVSIGGVSRPRPAAADPSAVRRAFLNTVGQQLARLTAVVSPRSVITATLDETSTFTSEQKAARTAHIMDTPAVRALFTAMFDTTFPYSRRMPGTDNDAVMARLAPPLERITAPALVVHGTQDGDVAFADGTHAAARIPGAEHLWLDAEDHLGFWLGPNAAAAQSTVGEFLARHATGGGR
jgi:pimeloyl-ACP methyl ester carboxylesterase